MKLFLCEKPSQARDIARVLGASDKKKSCIEGSEVIVTWCYGHMLELAPPGAYRDPDSWEIDTLPVVPSSWISIPREEAKSQLDAIGELLNRVDHVVIATDADREGELIGRDVLAYHQFDGTIERLWLSALDEQSIRRALETIRPGSATEGLYYAGLGRRRADWLLGMNLTRAATNVLSVSGGEVLSVGRVQTPTLRLVVDRDAEAEAFVSREYYTLRARFGSTDDRSVWATWRAARDPNTDEENSLCYDRALVTTLVDSIRHDTASVRRYDESPKKQPPPLPFSLSALQKKASSLYGLSAKQVLNAAQSLYERHKAITYPRTDTGYLPETQHGEAPTVLNALVKIDATLSEIKSKCDVRFKSPAWNDKKVTAHHGIIPTTNFNVSVSSMGRHERKIYDLVRRHYIAQFLWFHEFTITSVEISCSNQAFAASSRKTTKPGWKVAFTDDHEEREFRDASEIDEVPKFFVGESVSAREAVMETKATKPPPRFTEGSLIDAMKSVARYVSDPELKKVLRDTAGIGTEATRANILESLIDRDYVRRHGRSLVSTPKGRALIEKVPDPVKDPATTARWEQTLDDIAQGSGDLDAFMASQVQSLESSLSAFRGLRSDPDRSIVEVYPCATCSKPMVRRRNRKSNQTFWGCSAYPECMGTLPDHRGAPAYPMPSMAGPDGPIYSCTCRLGTLSKHWGKYGGYWRCSRGAECLSTFKDVMGFPAQPRTTGDHGGAAPRQTNDPRRLTEPCTSV